MNGDRENPKECVEHVTKRKMPKRKTYIKMTAEVRKNVNTEGKKNMWKMDTDGQVGRRKKNTRQTETGQDAVPHN